MIDTTFTNEIGAWLEADPQERSLEQGAKLLLQLNRNLFMNRHILLKEDWERLEYELQKHYDLRLAAAATEDAAASVAATKKAVEQTLRDDAPTIDAEQDTPAATRRGRRSDHEDLPAEIQALYDRGEALYFKLRELHATLSEMETRGVSSCDKLETCHALKLTHDAYRDGWIAYDNYGKNTGRTLTDEEIKAISAARKYLSTNKAKLAEATGAAQEELRTKMQERVNLLLGLEQVFTPETETELKALGLLLKND